MIDKTAVLVFVKYPTAGKVKTRLAADIGEDKAVFYYRKMVQRVQAALNALDPETFAVHWMYDSANSESNYRDWLKSNATYLPQHYGDLGQRLAQAFDVVREKYSTACAIGTDCIEITPKHFTLTRTALETHNAVLGPSVDGGYYLIGLKGNFPQLFQNISWSTEKVADQTRAKIASLRLPAYELPVLPDIDTWQDLQASNLIE